MFLVQHSFSISLDSSGFFIVGVFDNIELAKQEMNKYWDANQHDYTPEEIFRSELEIVATKGVHTELVQIRDLELNKNYGMPANKKEEYVE